MTTAAAPTTASNIAQNALLANLKVTTWTARRFDRAVSDAVAQSYQAQAGVSRVTKKLVPDSFTSYHQTMAAAGKIRTYHYRNTTPWLDRGARLLPAAHYMAYVTNMRKLVTEFETASAKFVAAYPQLLQDAPTLLGNLYRASDFPPANQIKHLFTAELVFIPFVDVQDIRCNLGTAAELDKLMQETQARLEEALDAATNDLASRLSKQIAKIAEYGRRGKDKLPKQTIDGLRELCALIPQLNITGNVNLQTFADRALQELDRPDQKPEDAADKAQHIVDDLAAFMGNNNDDQDDDDQNDDDQDDE